MISTKPLWLIALILAGSGASANAQAPAPATATSSTKALKRLASLMNIATALTSAIGSIGTVLAATDKLITTGSEIIDRASAKALLERLNKLSAATSRTLITQEYVIRSMEDYAAAWEPDSPQMTSWKRAHLKTGWENVRKKVLDARSAVAKLDKVLVKESGPFARDVSYQQLYGAVVARRELLGSLDLDGPSILAAEEVDALRKVSKAYAQLHLTLKPAIDSLNTYISALEEKQAKGTSSSPKPGTTATQ
jgi:hypothetical protein